MQQQAQQQGQAPQQQMYALVEDEVRMYQPVEYAKPQAVQSGQSGQMQTVPAGQMNQIQSDGGVGVSPMGGSTLEVYEMGQPSVTSTDSRVGSAQLNNREWVDSNGIINNGSVSSVNISVNDGGTIVNGGYGEGIPQYQVAPQNGVSTALSGRYDKKQGQMSNIAIGQQTIHGTQVVPDKHPSAMPSGFPSNNPNQAGTFRIASEGGVSGGVGGKHSTSQPVDLALTGTPAPLVGQGGAPMMTDNVDGQDPTL